MVKDLRTGVETTAIDDVMAGDLEAFIQAYLRQENQVCKSRRFNVLGDSLKPCRLKSDPRTTQL
jgi:hypothetical protein